MSEATVAAAAKAKTEYTNVTMTDGRVVPFAGKKKMLKDILIQGDEVSVRFDFLNGVTKTYPVPPQHLLYSAGHGWGQKLGDSVAGLKTESGDPASVDDMVETVDELATSVSASDSWNTEAKGGAATGGSIIVKAMAELLTLTVEAVRQRIDKRLADAEAKGEKLTRAALYKSYRKTESLAPIIKRLEDEAAAKEKSTLDGESELAELLAMS